MRERSRAVRVLNQFGRMTPEEQAKQQGRDQHAAEQRDKLAPSVATLSLKLPDGAPPGTEVKRDGVVLANVSLGLALPVDSGPHTVTVQPPGGAIGTQTITSPTAQTRKQQTLTSSQPPPLPERLRARARKRRRRPPAMTPRAGTANASRASSSEASASPASSSAVIGVRLTSARPTVADNCNAMTKTERRFDADEQRSTTGAGEHGDVHHRRPRDGHRHRRLSRRQVIARRARRACRGTGRSFDRGILLGDIDAHPRSTSPFRSRPCRGRLWLHFDSRHRDRLQARGFGRFDVIERNRHDDLRLDDHDVGDHLDDRDREHRLVQRHRRHREDHPRHLDRPNTDAGELRCERADDQSLRRELQRLHGHGPLRRNVFKIACVPTGRYLLGTSTATTTPSRRGRPI